MKFCKDCRFLEHRDSSQAAAGGKLMTLPLPARTVCTYARDMVLLDPVWGHPSQASTTDPWALRGAMLFCGPDARWFKERDGE